MVLVAVVLAGFLVFIVGVLFTQAITFVAMADVYLQMTTQAPLPTPLKEQESIPQ